jgi:hypothetical protein
MQEISQLDEELLASQEGISSMRLVGWLVGWLVGLLVGYLVGGSGRRKGDAEK